MVTPKLALVLAVDLSPRQEVIDELLGEASRQALTLCFFVSWSERGAANQPST